MKPVVKKLIDALPKLPRGPQRKATTTAKSGTIHMFMRVSQMLSALSSRHWTLGRSEDSRWDEEQFVSEYAGEIAQKADGKSMLGKGRVGIEVRRSVEVETVSRKA